MWREHIESQAHLLKTVFDVIDDTLARRVASEIVFADFHEVSDEYNSIFLQLAPGSRKYEASACKKTRNRVV